MTAVVDGDDAAQGDVGAGAVGPLSVGARGQGVGSRSIWRCMGIGGPLAWYWGLLDLLGDGDPNHRNPDHRRHDDSGDRQPRPGRSIRSAQFSGSLRWAASRWTSASSTRCRRTIAPHRGMSTVEGELFSRGTAFPNLAALLELLAARRSVTLLPASMTKYARTRRTRSRSAVNTGRRTVDVPDEACQAFGAVGAGILLFRA